MKASILSLFCILWGLAAGASIPRYFEKQAITRRDLTAKQIREELGLRVSNTTLIFGPEACRFEEATSRWTDSSKPDVQVVIEPGTESDVATIVRPQTATDYKERSHMLTLLPKGPILQREQHRFFGTQRRTRRGGKS